jgi:hypothetical protein
MALQNRLRSLESIARDTDRIYGEIESELKQNIRSYEKVKDGVDVTADVLNILVGLSSIVKNGMRAMTLDGIALEEANKELSREVLKFGAEPVGEGTFKYWGATLNMNDGLLWAYGKITVNSWFNMTSPSFWAGVYTNLKAGKTWQQAVTEDPKTALEEALQRVIEQHNIAIESVKSKIAATSAELFGSSVSHGVALHRL